MIFNSNQAGAIPGYADELVNELLAKGTVDDVRWFWALIKTLRSRWPQADHYAVATTPPDVRIGIKQKDKTRGQVAFRIRWSKDGFTCDARDLKNHLELLQEKNIPFCISSRTDKKKPAVGSWLESVVETLPDDSLPLTGAGRMPSAYEGSDFADDATDTVAGTGTEPAAMPPLNQILHGPPGTGKTYATIDHALAILAPAFLAQNSGNDPETRKRLKAEFDRFVAADRVRFVTFHQSFSYEDFVEGLRALPPGSEENPGQALSYGVASGVFVQLCQEALGDRELDQQLGLKPNPSIWKISIEEASSDGKTRRYCFKHGEARIGWPQTGDLRQANLDDPTLKLGSNDRSSLDSFARGVEPGDVLVCLGTRKSICAVGVVTGEYEYQPTVPAGVREDYVHRLPVNWLVSGIDFDITRLNGHTGLTLKTLYRLNRLGWGELKKALQDAGHSLAASSPATMAEKLPYVLIIDEINRGNVSRIFGELITLIEPSKRADAEEALEVLLPYSKKPFSVPENVYLIGTMNSTDRSLAGLDIALRRRFTFREMPPRPALLEGVSVEGVAIGPMLAVMNQRITALLDRDHCLGHAYFMPLRQDPTKERLMAIFRSQILPLLQEYFFEDWERIGWVLNDQNAQRNGSAPFIRPAATQGDDLQALFGSEVAGQLSDHRWELNPAALASIDSYRNIGRTAG